MPFGPILWHELTRTSRRDGFYVMRSLLGLVVLWALIVVRQGYPRVAGWEARYHDPASLPWLADMLVVQWAWLLALAVLLVVPGLVVVSITEEDRRGTMLDLLGSPLSSGSIVLGKLAARLVHVGALLATGLPLVVLVGLPGDHRPSIVARAGLLLAGLTVFVATLSILAATVVRGPRRALVAAYVLVGGWMVVGVALAPAARRPPPSLSWLKAIQDANLLGHPGMAAMYLGRIPEAMLFDRPTRAAWAWARLDRALPRVVGIQVACSAVFAVLAVLLLRPSRLGWRRRGLIGSGRSNRAAIAPARPPVGDDPMRWKECHASPRGPSAGSRFAMVAFGALLIVPLIGPARDSALEWWRAWFGHATFIHARLSANESLRNVCAMLSLLGFAAVAATAATSVTGERERGTWISLTPTELTGRVVVRAKVAGAIRSLRGPACAFLWLWGIGLVSGSVHPIGVLAAALALFVFARYAAAVGVLISLVSRDSERALAGTFLALLAVPAFALLFLPLNLVGPLAGSGHGLLLASVTPFVEWAALASSIEVGETLVGWTVGARISLPWNLWSTAILLNFGLVRIYAAGVVAHAIVTPVLVRLAAWAYDRRGHMAAQ
jgi:hypothetical protein